MQPFVDPQKLKDFVRPKSELFWPDIIRIQIGSLIDLGTNIEKQQEEKAYALEWQTVKDIRPVLLKAIEIEREKGLIKHSLEAQVTAFIDMQKPEFAVLKDFFERLKAQGETPEAFFKEFLIVSQFKLVPTREGLHHTSDEGIGVKVTHAEGVKCPRCWQWDISNDPDGLCKRCQRIVRGG